MRNVLIVSAFLLALAAVAHAAGGLKLPVTSQSTGDGKMTHGPGTPMVGATVTAGVPDQLVVDGVPGIFMWDGDKYVNANGFYYRFEEHFHWRYGDKWIGEYGGVSGPISTCAFRYGMAD